MHPILFEIGSVVVYSYGVFYLLGMTVGFLLLRKYMLRQGFKEDDPYWVFGVIVTAALIGARVFGLYLRPDQGLFSWSQFLLWAGSWYGGLIAALISLPLVARLRHHPLAKVMDAAAVGVAAGHATGRIGCFLTGCCWGTPTQLPWGVTYTSMVAHQMVGVPLKTPVHPVQLYESFLEYGLLVLLILLMRTSFAGTGFILGTYLVGYGIIRFFLEFLRGNPHSLIAGPLDIQQVISLGMIACGIWLCVRSSRTRRVSPRALRTSV